MGGLYVQNTRKHKGEKKHKQAKHRGTGTGGKMKSDRGKKDFEIYMETHSDWGFCSILT